jgi:hypothetical protein
MASVVVTNSPRIVELFPIVTSTTVPLATHHVKATFKRPHIMMTGDLAWHFRDEIESMTRSGDGSKENDAMMEVRRTGRLRRPPRRRHR